LLIAETIMFVRDMHSPSINFAHISDAPMGQ